MALPSFYCVSFLQSIWGVYLFIFPIKLADAFVVASIMPYISSFFPTQCRYSAVALSTSLGVIIAGFTPAVALFLTDFCGTKMAPAFWMMGFAALVLMGIEIRKRYLASQPPQEGEESNLKKHNWGAAA